MNFDIWTKNQILERHVSNALGDYVTRPFFDQLAHLTPPLSARKNRMISYEIIQQEKLDVNTIF